MIWETKNINPIKNRTPLRYSAKLLSPAVISSVIFILLSYLIDLIFAFGSYSSFGESTAVSSVFFGTGQIIQKFSLILVSLGIIKAKACHKAIPAAVIGSLLLSNGCTFSEIGGSLAGNSGIFGSIIIGYTAVLYKKLFCKLINRINKEYNQKQFLSFLIPIPLTIITALSLGSISKETNAAGISLLTILAENKNILLPMVIGIFTVIDGGGPLHLCSYVFGTTSLIAEEPQVMAVITAAGMVPPLACALFAYIYKDRLAKIERKSIYMGVLPAIAGLPQISYIFYISKGLQILLPSIAGSLAASVLSVMLGCSHSAVSGGFLNINSVNNPMYLGLCIIFGVLISTALMTLTIPDPNKSKSKNNKKDIKTQSINRNTAKT